MSLFTILSILFWLFVGSLILKIALGFLKGVAKTTKLIEKELQTKTENQNELPLKKGIHPDTKKAMIGLVLGVFVLVIVVIIGVNQRDSNQQSIYNHTKTTSDDIQISVDTSWYFIKKLLNSSPKEVAKILGEPDNGIKATKDLPAFLSSGMGATYQNGKYDIVFYKNKLKYLYLDGTIGLDKIPFNKTAISYIGFEQSEPTFINPELIIAWRSAETSGTATGQILSIVGIREIYLHSNGSLGIEIEKQYNDKF